MEIDKTDNSEKIQKDQKKSPSPNRIETKEKAVSITKEEKSEIYSDSLKQIELISLDVERKDSVSRIDSFIVENPSLISLQLALRDYLNNKGFQRSKNEELILKIEKSMQDYYKMKYPTPIHKFGEQTSGTGIKIPIDKIIEVFE